MGSFSIPLVTICVALLIDDMNSSEMLCHGGSGSCYLIMSIAINICMKMRGFHDN